MPTLRPIVFAVSGMAREQLNVLYSDAFTYRIHECDTKLPGNVQ